MKRLLILTFTILFAFTLAYSQEVQQQTYVQEVKQEVKKEDKPEWKLGFTVFTGYFYNPSTIQANATNFNSFYLERVYIDYRVDFKNGLKIRITPDINPTTSGWILRLKYAYFDLSLLDKILVLSGGITKTEWVSYVDDFVGMRYITKSVADKYGVRSSADIGLNFSLKPIDGVEVFVGLFDGNGYSKGSDNLQTNLNYINVTKEIGTRLEVSPIYILTGQKEFSKIVLALHSYNTISTLDMTNANAKEVYGAAILLNYMPLVLSVDYSVFSSIKQNVSAVYGNYFGALGKVNFEFLGLKELSLVGAYYIYDQDIDITDNESQFYVLGAEYALNKNFLTSLNVKVDQKKNGYKDFNGNKVDYQTVIYIDNQIKF
ncbi:MAG: hypothetical protein ACK4F9_01340 [Brevinematia bacterium]